MSKRGKDHFVQFEEHTRLKHAILDKYVKQWAQKLLHWGKAGPEVWFVDAFAGEGGDQHGNPGSPVIAGRIAEDILHLHDTTPSGSAPMRVLAIEIADSRCARLRDAMKPFTDRTPPIAEVRCGTLHERLDQFMSFVKQRPVLFFLDPFGVDGLVLNDLPKLLSGPSNEVFALFSDTGARRLHATLRTPERDVEFEVSQVLQQPTLFGDDEAEAARKRAEAERSNAALLPTQKGARRILEEALGEDASEDLRRVPDDELSGKATELWMRGLIAAGARLVYSLPVRDARNAHVYQLVYATKSPVGLQAMKQAMQAALNSSLLPEEVVEGIRGQLEVNSGDVIRNLEERFRGQADVRWTEVVQPYLIQETPLLPAQATEIRKQLENRGYATRKRPCILRFPD